MKLELSRYFYIRPLFGQVKILFHHSSFSLETLLFCQNLRSISTWLHIDFAMPQNMILNGAEVEHLVKVINLSYFAAQNTVYFDKQFISWSPKKLLQSAEDIIGLSPKRVAMLTDLVEHVAIKLIMSLIYCQCKSTRCSNAALIVSNIILRGCCEEITAQ